jgi:polyphosphate kinase 2 (PPK2 family)
MKIHKKYDQEHYNAKGALKKKIYTKELTRLQEELVKLQYWIKDHSLKVVVIFEGRDAAGKGGVIKRITRRLNPRMVRVVALGCLLRKKKTVVFPALCQPAANSG